MTAATLVGVTACSAGDDDSVDEPAMDTAAAEDAADVATEEPADESALDGDATGSMPTRAEALDGLDIGIVGRDVIIEMHVVMSSDDIARTVASISSSAAQLGGGVASSSVDYGDPTSNDGREGHAVLVVKVPPERVDRLLAGLDASGTVRSIEQSAQDVTEQLVDLDVRIANARESVTNVREFMQQATDLNQLVTLESELTMRQTELERLEAQQRNLSERVALSTVTVEVVPSTALPAADDGDDSLGQALDDGWRAFVTVLFAIVYLLTTLLPFLLVGIVLGSLVIALARRRRRADDRRHDDTDHGVYPTDDDADRPLVGSTSDDGAD